MVYCSLLEEEARLKGRRSRIVNPGELFDLIYYRCSKIAFWGRWKLGNKMYDQFPN